mmetsp:Transcript_40386/g.126402  ORF Transcript_40386/g.126402 Transcript_40386/m.126402 type:complete len:309 (-) Transcript_40386:487-1413(-)
MPPYFISISYRAEALALLHALAADVDERGLVIFAEEAPLRAAADGEGDGRRGDAEQQDLVDERRGPEVRVVPGALAVLVRGEPGDAGAGPRQRGEGAEQRGGADPAHHAHRGPHRVGHEEDEREGDGHDAQYERSPEHELVDVDRVTAVLIPDEARLDEGEDAHGHERREAERLQHPSTAAEQADPAQRGVAVRGGLQVPLERLLGHGEQRVEAHPEAGRGADEGDGRREVDAALRQVALVPGGEAIHADEDVPDEEPDAAGGEADLPAEPQHAVVLLGSVALLAGLQQEVEAGVGRYERRRDERRQA